MRIVTQELLARICPRCAVARALRNGFRLSEPGRVQGACVQSMTNQGQKRASS